MVKKQKVTNELVFIIEYRVSPEDAGAIGEVMDKMREVGAAEITDVRVEPIQVNT